MTVMIKELSPEMCEQWDNYVARSSASVYHAVRWRDLIKNIFGHDGYYFYAANDHNEIIGILPMIRMKSMMFGDFLTSMPYFNYGGAIADNENIEEQLIKYAQDKCDELGCSHVEYRDVKERKINLGVRTDKVTMVLQLPEDPEILWKSIGAKRRSQAKRPIREGVEFVTGGKELLDEFYSVFSINMRDLGTPVYGKDFFESIIDNFPEKITIAVVRLGGEPVAAGFLITDKQTMEIPWASTLRKVNRIGVNMYLYWNILKLAIEKKCKRFDFGRSSKDAGTLKFKKQWGGEEQQLYWYYYLPGGVDMPALNPNNSKFSLAISIWKKLPVWFANLVGPHIVKNLP